MFNDLDSHKNILTLIFKENLHNTGRSSFLGDQTFDISNTHVYQPKYDETKGRFQMCMILLKWLHHFLKATEEKKKLLSSQFCRRSLCHMCTCFPQPNSTPTDFNRCYHRRKTSNKLFGKGLFNTGVSCYQKNRQRYSMNPTCNIKNISLSRQGIEGCIRPATDAASLMCRT